MLAPEEGQRLDLNKDCKQSVLNMLSFLKELRGSRKKRSLLIETINKVMEIMKRN